MARRPVRRPDLAVGRDQRREQCDDHSRAAITTMPNLALSGARLNPRQPFAETCCRRRAERAQLDGCSEGSARASSLLGVQQPRVDRDGENIRDEVEQDVGGGKDQAQACTTGMSRLDTESTISWPSRIDEHHFDHDDADDQIGEVERDDVDDRRQALGKACRRMMRRGVAP